MSPDHGPELQRSLGLTRATALVVGTIIGASIFVQPSEITGHVPSIPAIILVWLVSGVLTFFGALVCAELASAFPRTGGVYVFLREAFSPALGFLWGWAMLVSMHSGIIAAIAVVFARYLGYFVELDAAGTRAAAVAVILGISAINYVGVRAGSAVQTAFTLGKLLAIAAIIVLGVALTPAGIAGASPAEPPALPAGVTLGGFALALVAGLFAFGGWHMVTYTAGETVDPRRTIPLALIFGTAIVTACYIALNAVYLLVLPLETVATSTRVAADAADALVGGGGAAVMSGLVMFSTFGAITGIVLAGPRVYLSMARDGLLFAWLGEVHPRFRTPHRAIVLQAVWSSALVVTGSYRALFTRVIYTEWIFFGLMALGIYLLRRRPSYTPAYRVWGHPVVPAVFIASSFAIVIHQIVRDPIESLTGLAMVGIGLPVYYLWVARGAQQGVPASDGHRLP